MADSRVWLITGASGGLGGAFAEAALQSGDRVLCAARNRNSLSSLLEKYPEQAYGLSWDVTDEAGGRSAIEEGIRHFGRLDIVVNNAGTGIYGAIEELTGIQIEELFRINLLGPFFVLKAALPQLRKQRSGHIINISSMSGIAGQPGMGAYNITKFALEGMSEALAEEVKPLGIKVTIVEPGPFRTGFGKDHADERREGMPDYEGTSGKLIDLMLKLNQWAPGDPKKAAQMLLKLSRSEDPPLRLTLGAFAVESVRTKLRQVEQDLAAWESDSRSTDFPGSTPPAAG